MTMVMAPILPHLAEEIHDAHEQSGSSRKTIHLCSSTGWRSVVQARLEVFVEFANGYAGEEWNDSNTDRDIRKLLTVRSTLMTVLEQAHIDKYV